jgi:hypothetical protein
VRTLTLAILIVTWAGFSVQAPGHTTQTGPAAANPQSCAPLGAAFMRTTLYFGLNRQSGSVTEGQWRDFLRNQVTPRFPQGLTVWEANGQWRRSDGRISRERSKVLLLVHAESPEVQAALTAIIENYKREFQQESVLWETAQVCAAF